MAEDDKLKLVNLLRLSSIRFVLLLLKSWLLRALNDFRIQHDRHDRLVDRAKSFLFGQDEEQKTAETVLARRYDGVMIRPCFDSQCEPDNCFSSLRFRIVRERCKRIESVLKA
jgi:hypothetical protein